MTVSEWRELAKTWRVYGCTKLATDLDALLDTVESVTARLEAAKDHALDNPNAEEADRLRRILWPAKGKT